MGHHHGIFWLHIKKSAGQSTRKMLHPLYREVDRGRKPACFIQSDPADYNDILNNYRVPLGNYQFRRSLFAKKYLYQERFDELLKFAFCRNPVDRCISQFFYLWHRGGAPQSLALPLLMLRDFRFTRPVAYDFDRFLVAIEEARESDSYNKPYGLHFRTHVAAMWDDITDEDGKMLLDHVFRLEDLHRGVNLIRERSGLKALDAGATVHRNRTNRSEFRPIKRQIARIEQLFGKDFDIYEGQCDRHL